MKTISFAKLRHMFDNIFDTIFFEGDICMINTMWNPYIRIEKSVKIIYLRSCSYCRSWVIGYCLLVNGNSWRKSSNLPDMSRLRYIWDNSTSICWEWLQIPSLSFCIERIKGKWWFSRSRYTSNDCECVFRYWNWDILEIMCFCTNNIDWFWHGNFNKNTIFLSYSIESILQ